MLESLFDYTPEELAHILSLTTLGLLKEGAFKETQEEEAIEAAYIIVALDLSGKEGLTEDEIAEAVDKLKLYVQTNDIMEN